MPNRDSGLDELKLFRPNALTNNELHVDPTTFAAMAAHELREPLQAIRSFLSVVVSGRVGPLSELQTEFLTSANHAARRAGRMVEDFLIVVQGGQPLDLRLAPVSVLNRVRACCWELSNIEDHREINAVSALADDDTMVAADHDRIDQIILNLLENACRYGLPDQPIDVNVWRDESGIVFSVTNAFDQKDMNPSTWFQPFYRGANSVSPGMGLGLSVASWLVHAHGGGIAVKTIADRVTVEVNFPALGNLSSHIHEPENMGEPESGTR